MQYYLNRMQLSTTELKTGRKRTQTVCPKFGLVGHFRYSQYPRRQYYQHHHVMAGWGRPCGSRTMYGHHSRRHHRTGDMARHVCVYVCVFHVFVLMIVVMCAATVFAHCARVSVCVCMHVCSQPREYAKVFRYLSARSRTTFTHARAPLERTRAHRSEIPMR